MPKVLSILSLLLVAGGVSLATQESRKVLEMGAEECESEMAFLDAFANYLHDEPYSSGYILVYGGRRDTKRDEIQVRGARIRRYLIESRGVGADRVAVATGGYREKFAVELWLTPRGGNPPAATPTVNQKAVRFKRGQMERWREPGCFPGKYIIPKPRPA